MKRSLFKLVKLSHASRCFMSMLMMLLVTTVVFAQTVSISGTIKDEHGETVIGANVSIKGTTIGGITDIDGKYSIQAPNNRSTVVISYIGFITQEIVVGNQSVINVTLKDDTQRLEEVVVVGYGTQKKVTVTGAVASVSGAELKQSPTTNLSNGMLGRMPGVIGFSRADEPGGGGTTIRIRGTNSLGSKDPLVVIDGIADRAGGFNRLNPSEIETISVLKDAAAAIYGSRAANGVILVTTKRGKEGRPTVSFEGSYGLGTPIRLPKMANAFEYATMMNEITPNTYGAEALQKFQDGSDPWAYPNTDWYKAAIKDISPLYRVDLGVNGGSDKFKYYINLAANGEDGVYKNSANRYDQYSFRINMDLKASKYVDFTFGTALRLQHTKYPAKDAGSIFSALRRGKPTQPAFWPTGEPAPDIEYGDNPAVTSTDLSGFDNQRRYYVQNNATVNISVPWVEGLKLTGNVSYDKFFYNRKIFSKPIYLYYWNGVDRNSTGLSPSRRWIADPNLRVEGNDQTDWLANFVINYSRTFGKHTVGGMVGIEAQSKFQENWNEYRRYFLSDQTYEINLGGVRDQTTNGMSWEESRINYFGRVNYNYLERYLIEFVFRMDGSYRFPKEKRYGFFPGVSAAWRASEETFWKENIPFIEYFKLRGSISQTGNDALLDVDGNYDRSIQYLNTFGIQSNYIFGTAENSAIAPTRTPNTKITWEVGTTYNIGLDFKFLNGRLGWESDLFYHKRTNMLISRNASLPQISGITLPRENIGEMENKGFETMFTWNDKAGDFTYGLNLNMTYANNKITFWDETPGVPEWQKSTGLPVGATLRYEAAGIFRDQAHVDATPAKWAGAQPGDIIFRDVNNDGKINADDRVRQSLGTEPRFVGGLTANIGWKGWDLMVMFQGAAGSTTYIQTWSGTVGNFLKDFYDKRWTPDNPNASGPRTYERENQYWINSSNTYWLRSGDYVRLKNVELGYNFNLPSLKKAGISKLRLYCNANNLLTFDYVKVTDPEADNSSITQYPQRRIINFGVSASF